MSVYGTPLRAENWSDRGLTVLCSDSIKSSFLFWEEQEKLNSFSIKRRFLSIESACFGAGNYFCRSCLRVSFSIRYEHRQRESRLILPFGVADQNVCSTYPVRGFRVGCPEQLCCQPVRGQHPDGSPAKGDESSSGITPREFIRSILRFVHA